MHVLIVTFELNGLSAEAYAAHCARVAPRFAALPGLISKSWLADEATNTYGGVYLWEDRADLEAYLDSELFRGLLANPAFANVTATTFATLPEPTARTAGHMTPVSFSIDSID